MFLNRVPPLAEERPVALSALMEMLCFCAVQDGSHCPHMAVEHLTCGRCDGGTRLLIVISLSLNIHMCLLAAILVQFQSNIKCSFSSTVT